MKHNFFNLFLLLAVGLGFILCVVSVMNTIITFNCVALPVPVTPTPTNASAATNTTTAPAPPPPTVAVSHRQPLRRYEVEQDFPLQFQAFTITCSMFKNCTRSGAGVAPDTLVGDLSVLSSELGCGSARIVRGFCLATFALAVTATAAAAGAAQELSCAQRVMTRRVILGTSLLAFLMSIPALTLLVLLQDCMTQSVSDISVFDGLQFFSHRAATVSVDSTAMPLYATVMAATGTTVIMSILWIWNRVGPPVVEPQNAEEGSGDGVKPTTVGDQSIELLKKDGLLSSHEDARDSDVLEGLLTQHELQQALLMPQQRGGAGSSSPEL